MNTAFRSFESVSHHVGNARFFNAAYIKWRNVNDEEAQLCRSRRDHEIQTARYLKQQWDRLVNPPNP